MKDRQMDVSEYRLSSKGTTDESFSLKWTTRTLTRMAASPFAAATGPKSTVVSFRETGTSLQVKDMLGRPRLHVDFDCQAMTCQVVSHDETGRHAKKTTLPLDPAS